MSLPDLLKGRRIPFPFINDFVSSKEVPFISNPSLEVMSKMIAGTSISHQEHIDFLMATGSRSYKSTLADRADWLSRVKLDECPTFIHIDSMSEFEKEPIMRIRKVAAKVAHLPGGVDRCLRKKLLAVTGMNGKRATPTQKRMKNTFFARIYQA